MELYVAGGRRKSRQAADKQMQGMGMEDKELRDSKSSLAARKQAGGGVVCALLAKRCSSAHPLRCHIRAWQRSGTLKRTKQLVAVASAAMGLNDVTTGGALPFL
eukprot:m.9708 g.9708  ORF g.9708 m.9708 type:complete len:104 (-) comp2444_c0_seq2:2278-2589(-)